MWQTYSKSYLKHNGSASSSIRGASLAATTFLSLLCSLAYNVWAYEVATGGQSDLTPLVVLFLAVLAMVSFSLALMIRSPFEISMGARVHQFGILSSIGATPKQIRKCLSQEAAMLCAVPIGLGCLLGIALCYGVMQCVNFFAAGAAGRQDAVFQYHVGVLALTVLSSGFTVFLSQSAPARKLSKLTPIQAIRNSNGLTLKKSRRSCLLSALFGIEGEIAGNALKAQKKALQITNLSLLLSFLSFTMILCFFTLSSISTRHTYFERYQACWDIMVTVKDSHITGFSLTDALQDLPGIREATVYQKAEGTYLLSEEAQSRELLALGGYGALKAEPTEDGTFQVKAPVIILDDNSFLRYCRQIGIEGRLDGTIILNQIWDNVNSNFRCKDYIPFLKETRPSISLAGIGEDLPVLSYAREAPPLREEYPNYALVHFLPQSLWAAMGNQAEEADTFIRIFAGENTSLASLNALQDRVAQLLSPAHEILIENRIQERVSNDRMIAGYQWILGFFCVLLAMVGITNVFTNTFAFLRSRKREFAQYMSIGLTPGQMKKLFAIEAFVIAGKPLMLTLPLTLLFVEFAATASYLDSREFWAEAPVLPILLFGVAIVFFVALAYYLGGKRILQCDLSETLRKDALM